MIRGRYVCIAVFGTVMSVAACAPVVHRAPVVTVTNPIFDDPETIAFSVIARKDMRAGHANRIIGQRQHVGEGVIEEYSEIVRLQPTRGDTLFVDVGVCSVHPDGLVFAEDYRAILHVAGRADAVGELRQTWKQLDLTEKTSGMGLYPHQVIRGRDGSGQVIVRQLQHVEERENVTELYCRRARYKFDGDPLFDADTAWVEVVLEGDQRRRIWRYRLKRPDRPAIPNDPPNA